jgi:ParB family chromosome partitioning protein
MPPKKKSGLGSGLDGLIPKKNPSTATTTSTKKVDEPKEVTKADLLVSINKVEPNREQPRKFFDEDKLLELSESIKQHGIISPIIVQKREDYFEIIAGERRWRAAKMAGLKEVPVLIRDLSEQEIMEIALIENLQREDLNAMEEALGYQQIIEKFKLKQDELAEKVSKSRTAITNSLRLLKLDERVQQMVRDDLIQTGHARALLGISDPDKQYEFAQMVFDKRMTVRDVEKAIKKLQKEKQDPKPQTKEDAQRSIIYRDLEENLKGIIGTKVNILSKDENKGKIEIEYYTKEELDRIIEMLRSIRM